MMKKISIALIMLMALTLTACGRLSDITAVLTNEDTKEVENTDTEGTSNPVKEALDDIAEVADEIIKEVKAPEDISTDNQIEETVIYDDNGIVIKAIDLDYNNNDVSVNLEITNNNDQEYSVLSGNSGYCCNSMNGYMMSTGYLWASVEPGETVSDYIRFRESEIQVYGITEVADIELAFTIEDEDYNEITTEPVRLVTKAASDYNYSDDTYIKSVKNDVLQYFSDCDVKIISETALAETADTRILSAVYVIDLEDGEASLIYEVENTSDQLVEYCISNITVNGYEVYEYSWAGDYLIPGHRAACTLELKYFKEKDAWIDAAIEDIETIGFTVSIHDANDYYNIFGEPFEVEFNVK